jgi:hypothetical protein
MLEKVNLSSAEMLNLAKVTAVVLGCMAVVIIAYLLFRWKIKADKDAIERLKSDKMRLEIEALAAEKLALRKAIEEKQKSDAAKTPKIAQPEEHKPNPDDLEDLPPLQF